MSFFESRRQRPTRQLRTAPKLRDRLTAMITDHQLVARLLLAAAAVMLLLIATQSWRSRFPWRSGQWVDAGIQSRVDFRVPDAVATQRAQDDAAALTPLVFRQHHEPLSRLASELNAQLVEITNARSFDDLSEETARRFGLTPAESAEPTPEPEAPSAEPSEESATGDPPPLKLPAPPSEKLPTFEEIRSVLSGSPMTVGDRIATLIQEFNQLMGPATQCGLVPAETISAIELGGAPPDRNTPIEVVDGNTGEPLHYGIVADILIEEQLQETGRIGRRWPDAAELSAIKGSVNTWIRNSLRRHLTFDVAASDDRRRENVAAVEPRFTSFAVGDRIVESRTQLTNVHILRLSQEFEAFENQKTMSQRLQRVGGMTLLLTLLVTMHAVYLCRYNRALLENIPRLAGYLVICAVTVLLGCVLSRDPWRAEIVPLMATVITFCIVFGQSLALLTAFSLSLLICAGTLGNVGHFAMLFTICTAVVIPLRQVSSRSTLITIGVAVSLIALLSVWSVRLIELNSIESAWRNGPALLEAAYFAGWSLLCCILIGGSLPFIESAFGVITDIRLLELSGVSQPLLQELARRAPGTYNHSMTVATIGEAAADAIGANGLLLRVGAYFHDIGKMMKPEYFIENISSGETSGHANLAPAMSALIIIGHVKDGLELAEQHSLPRELVDFIEQHHGTTLVEYFYHEAASRADSDHRTDADESTFRYPGPKPQTRETAVMMLADAVESASRSLKEPTAGRIQSLVSDITLKRLLDGQFDECGITMAELHTVQQSLVKSLLAVHHGRIKYPDAKPAKAEQRAPRTEQKSA